MKQRAINEKFGKISLIEAEHPETWENKIFLTFDIDWAHDEIIKDTIALVEQANVPATWFVTHDTPLLKALRANSKFELGIHPNFNFLLNGDPCKGANAEEVVDRLLEIVPEAKAVRCHSMTQSSEILQLFRDKELTHDCNHFMPEHAGFDLKPWYLWNGLIKVPYFWEDDLSFIYKQKFNILELVKRNGVKVFDFHPIHVFLNTENLDRYEQTRPLHHNSYELIKHQYKGQGTRTYLVKLLKFV